MKIDILSDLHLDFYFNNKLPLSKDAVKSIFNQIFFNNNKREPADVLIIAGDIGHYNEQNIEVLKILQKVYYKYIVCVLGNHDYYLISHGQKKEYDNNSYNRANEMIKQINSQDNMYCLDGNVIEIDGIKFGGAMGWYDDSYTKEYYYTFTKKSTNNMWKNISMDSEYIHGINNYDDLYHIEYPKLKKVYQDCDVMISHINPSYLHEHINSTYHNDQGNTFFTFDGHDLLKNGSMKYWIFGHTHDAIEYELYDKKVICNPLGYPSESNYGDWIWIKTIEINNA